MEEIPFSQINWVDVLVVILLVRMGYIGFRLGLSVELLKLSGTVGGICVGFRYYQAAGDWVAAYSFLSTEWASTLAMGVLVVAGYFGVTRLFRLGERLVQMSFEKRVNQVGGLAAGLVRGALVASVVLVACMQLPAPHLQESIDPHSVSGKAVSKMAPAVYDTLAGFTRRLRSG